MIALRLATKLLEAETVLVRAAIIDVWATAEEIPNIIRDKACVFLAGLHAAERVNAERLLSRLNGTPPRPEFDIAKALPRFLRQAIS